MNEVEITQFACCFLITVSTDDLLCNQNRTWHGELDLNHICLAIPLLENNQSQHAVAPATRNRSSPKNIICYTIVIAVVMLIKPIPSLASTVGFLSCVIAPSPQGRNRQRIVRVR